MTDNENDADDSTVQIIARTADEARGVSTALNALDAEHAVSHIYEFRVDAGAVHGDESDDETLGDVTELAGETEETGDEPAEGGKEKLESDADVYGDEGNGTSDVPDSPTDSGSGETGNESERGDDSSPQSPADSDTSGERSPESESETGNENSGKQSPKPQGDSSTNDTSGESSDDGDAGNSTGGHATTGTTSAAHQTAASSTTSGGGSKPGHTKTPGGSKGTVPQAISNLEHSEAARKVYGAVANANRRWVTSEEIAVGDEDLHDLGYSDGAKVSEVLRNMQIGGILERREMDDKRGRCKYEYRIPPGRQREGED